MSEAPQKSPVSTSRSGDITLIRIDNPPVNALGFAVRAALIAALDAADADPAVKAVVLTGGGKVFSGGADITEFGKPPKSPPLSQVNERCESMTKPLVAAISGVAFGGGLEVALSCHARVAGPDAQLALPEVKLGLLPGAGGTQRLPRVAGAKAALDMIVTGKPVGARKALTLGIVDSVIEGELIAGAVDFARALAADGAKPVAVRDRDDRLNADRGDIAGLEAHTKALLAKTRGLEAPRVCAQAVRIALDKPFDAALEQERDFFVQLMNGLESRAQRHLFFAEREAAKVAGVGRDIKPRPVASVAVIGAGTMGGGIAMSFANGGIPVTILELDQGALDRGLKVMAGNYDQSVKRGSISQEERDLRFGRLTGTTSYQDLADADLIIEAVFEEMAVKKQVFGQLDAIAKPGAILASNTSYLDIDEIAALTSRPADVLGMHFFSPANVMRLLEIVRGKQTAPDVLATALKLGKTIGKVPVVVGVCHGFVGNRMLSARSSELETLLLEGAMPEEVDKAFTDFGFPMGPFAMGDLAGLDIGWRNRKSLGKTAIIADALCEAGHYGQKTGKGFYLYENGSRKPTVDPEVSALIEAKARDLGINRRSISAEEIIERTVYPMVNEGARILAEGIAARASDIDIVWVHGYGFPVGKGGPMFWADHEGLGKIAERLRHWHGKTGNPMFEPAGLFARPESPDNNFANHDAGGRAG